MAPRTPNQKIIHFSILILCFLFWLFRYLFLTSNLPVFWPQNVLDLLSISQIYQLFLSYISYLTKSYDIWYNTAHDTTTLKLISLISFIIWHECLEKSNSASILLSTSSFPYPSCWMMLEKTQQPRCWCYYKWRSSNLSNIRRNGDNPFMRCHFASSHTSYSHS